MVDHFEGSFPPFPQAGIGGNLTSAIQGHGQVPLGKKPNSKMQEDRTQDYKLESNTQKKTNMEMAEKIVFTQFWSYRTLHVTGDKVPLCKCHDMVLGSPGQIQDPNMRTM